MNNIPEGATHVRRGGNNSFYKRESEAWWYFSRTNCRWTVSPETDKWHRDNLFPVADTLQTATTTAPSILEAAAGHMRDRAATYDKPEGERSMGATVQAFKAVTGISLTEEQGWLFMQLLKAVRSQQGAYRADSYEDGAAYVALAGEAAARDRQGGQS